MINDRNISAMEHVINTQLMYQILAQNNTTYSNVWRCKREKVEELLNLCTLEEKREILRKLKASFDKSAFLIELKKQLLTKCNCVEIK